MWSILVALLLGMAVGSFIKFSDKGKHLVGKLQFYGVVLLLFVMGISIGMNKEVLENISTIGIKALAFAVFTILASIGFVYLFTTLYLKRGKTQ